MKHIGDEVMVYHPAKVLMVFTPGDKELESADKHTLAMIKTWDENLMILLVDEKIENIIKKDDTVLADYRPHENTPVPRQIITKILRGKMADATWKQFAEHFEEVKKRAGIGTSVAPQQYIR
ncbi:MAG: hypothetical protein NT130_02830 [Candidatus Micrarchaeota archaeon]|nr:hypothetical protein [Candidatus Micrarchaeota archaeon]